MTQLIHQHSQTSVCITTVFIKCIINVLWLHTIIIVHSISITNNNTPLYVGV